MVTKVERSRRGLFGFYISLLKKAFNTDKLDFGHHLSGGLILFVVALALNAIRYPIGNAVVKRAC